MSDQTVVLADIAEESLEQMKSFIQYLLKGRVDEASAKNLAEFMTGAI